MMADFSLPPPVEDSIDRTVIVPSFLITYLFSAFGNEVKLWPGDVRYWVSVSTDPVLAKIEYVDPWQLHYKFDGMGNL